jgi:hypothetical protein
VGAFLHDAGHEVVAVDLDPVLIAAAEEDHPGPCWLVGDLAELDLPVGNLAGLDLPARGSPLGFDAIICAGNAMTFLAPATRPEVLRRLRTPIAARFHVARGRRGDRLVRAPACASPGQGRRCQARRRATAIA